MLTREKEKLLVAIKYDWKVPENFSEITFKDWIVEETDFINSSLKNSTQDEARVFIETYIKEYEIRETITGMTTGRHSIERSLVAALNNFIITTPEAEDYLLIKKRIDAAGGVISFYENECKNFKNIDSPNLLLLDEILKIIPMKPKSLVPLPEKPELLDKMLFLGEPDLLKSFLKKLSIHNIIKCDIEKALHLKSEIIFCGEYPEKDAAAFMCFLSEEQHISNDDNEIIVSCFKREFGEFGRRSLTKNRNNFKTGATKNHIKIILKP